MAIDLSLSNSNNSSAPRDLIFDNLTFAMTSGKDELVQRLTTRLLVFLGEWWKDVNLGVPYKEDVLIKNPLYDTIATDIKQTILETKGISKILSFRIDDTDGVQRSITISFDCQGDDGELLEFQALNLQVT